MATELLVEDGSMPPGANTYAGPADADAYLAARGVTAWAAGTDETKTAALIRAADTLNGYPWRGKTAEPGRVMAWPRVQMVACAGWIVPEGQVPPQVVNAQCELAGKIIAGSDPLAAVDTSKGAVISQKVDSLEVHYAEPSTNSYSGLTGFPAVDALLKPFLRAYGRNFSIGDTERG